ncbi:hypothetical protein [Faecalispora jeddahensis]|uniref:hypothetical protein n=1 Tax=Faecalispora jeddahensis TaxID=1414721 RepID=UPI0027B8FBA1|nr:hypothetical protein [Faecalispora jeddahensis]
MALAKQAVMACLVIAAVAVAAAILVEVYCYFMSAETYLLMELSSATVVTPAMGVTLVSILAVGTQ